jgi:DhnA family fructose-bisphosphate aldolase class Ia
MKFNHNELLTFPNKADQIFFSNVKQAYDMGAVAVGATIYFGSDQSDRQIVEVSQAFAHAHELGMATVLWCYLRNAAFKKEKDYHVSADLTGQANHLGVTIEADIIKQKLPENNGGYEALNMGNSGYGKFDKRIYTDLASDHPIDLCRYQVANCYMGRAGLINSGGASGANDFEEAVATAVINKRAGGTGLISGRKAFQRPMRKASSSSTPSRTSTSARSHHRLILLSSVSKRAAASPPFLLVYHLVHNRHSRRKRGTILHRALLDQCTYLPSSSFISLHSAGGDKPRRTCSSRNSLRSFLPPLHFSSYPEFTLASRVSQLTRCLCEKTRLLGAILLAAAVFSAFAQNAATDEGGRVLGLEKLGITPSKAKTPKPWTSCWPPLSSPSKSTVASPPKANFSPALRRPNISLRRLLMRT